MIRLTMAQMRQSRGRLAAAGVAIVIGTAFITITLLASGVLTHITRATLAASYAQADFVVSVSPFSDATLDDSGLATIAAVPGVAAVDPLVNSYTELRSDQRRTFTPTIGTSSDPRFATVEATDGRLPQNAREIALPTAMADRLKVSVGDRVESIRTTVSQDGESTESRETFTVVGIVAPPRGSFSDANTVITADLQRTWSMQDSGSTSLSASEAVVALDPGADRASVRSALTAAVPGMDVQTTAEKATQASKSLTGGQNVLLASVLSFAAIALVVAGLVIANTFQVLVAHRTRTLALLRAVGATRRQLSRSVITEGALLGIASSALGIVVGIALAQAALSVAGGMDLNIPLPQRIALSAWTVVIPLAVGTIVTTLACAAPARATARVSPLEALRPVELRESRRAGKARLAMFVALVFLGVVILGAGVLLGSQGSAEIGLAVTVLGCALSFTGLVLGGVFWLPALTAVIGRLLARTGPAGALAAANTLRNPRRTAATSAALLIGVTLVATMSTGAISARASSTQMLDEQFPIDLTVRTISDSEEQVALPQELTTQIAALPGVEKTVPVRTLRLTTNDTEFSVAGVDPGQLTDVSRDPAASAALSDDSILLNGYIATTAGIADGEKISVTGPAGTTKTLTVHITFRTINDAIITMRTAQEFAPNAVVDQTLVRIDNDRTVATSNEIEEATSSAAVTVHVEGAALERANFDRVINTILAIVVALLAAAVVIALIGVTNTLSLSVLERRRESATLRAIGLTRRQLRRTLALEGLLIAGVGAVCGSVLGVLYGWAGSVTALSLLGDVTLAVPWRDLGLLLAIALAAGWLASVLPARAATRTSPVASLGVE